MCNYNHIEHIEKLQLPELRILNCNNNYIKSIDRLKLPKLQKLKCSYNELTELVLPFCINVSEIEYTDNPFIYLDLRHIITNGSVPL